MILSALFAVLIVNSVSSEIRIVEPMPGEKLPIEDFVIDGCLIVATGEPIPPKDIFSPSTNMYDPEMHLEARLLVDQNMCLIRKFTETLEQLQGALDAAESTESEDRTDMTMELNIPGDEIPADELEAIVGAKLAGFCYGYDVYWLAKSQEGEQIEGRMTKRLKDFNWSVGGGLTYENGNFGGGISFEFSGGK